MRKINEDYENPIDHVLLHVVEPMCPTFKKLNLTPNDLTTFSLLFGLLSAYFLYTDVPMLFAVFYLVSYFFDCADGHYARKYGMTSKFGDLYDHIKDVTVVILLIGILIYKNKNCTTNLTIIASVLTVSFILLNVHLGCQERIYDSNESDTLAFQQKLCPGNPTENIKYTRWFGCGTFTLIFIAMVLYVEYTKKCI